MQIKNIILSALTLAAVNAAPLRERDTQVADYACCLTITVDPAQGLAFYKVPESLQAKVKSDCRTCVMKTANCTENCTDVFDTCAKEMEIKLN